MVHTHATVEQLAEVVQNDSNRWFAVVDACDEPIVPKISEELGDRSVCLYRGKSERDFWAVAPYLWSVDIDLLNRIVEDLGDKPWGILIRTPNDLEQTRRHCRRFLIVEGPDGKEIYFRYYDPRVLPTFIPTLTRDETHEFFGNHVSFTCPVSADAYQNFHLYRKESQAPPQQQLVVGQMVQRPTDVATPEYQHWLASRIGTGLQRTNRTVPPEVLSDQVTRGIRRAQEYGITHGADVSVYVENVCCYLGGFSDRPDPPAVQQCLKDDRYEVAIRVSRFKNLVRSQLVMG